jgi:hypothetical protein
MKNPEKHQVLEANLSFLKPAGLPQEIFRANKAVLSVNSPIKLSRDERPVADSRKIINLDSEMSKEK